MNDEHVVTSKGSKKAAILASLTASVLYGSQYVAIKMGLQGASPLLFGALSMGIGGVLALVLVLSRGSFSWKIFGHWEVWIGAVLATVMICLQYLGLTITSASIGGLLVGSNIIFVAPISALFFGESLGRRKIMGVVLGLLGIFTLTTRWDLAFLGSGVFFGDLLMLGASICIALTYPVTMKALRHMDHYQWAMSFHLLCPFLIGAVALLLAQNPSISEEALPFIAFVGLLCTSVPTILWANGLHSISFTTSATILLAESAVAVFLGVALLSELFDPIMIPGAILVFVSIFLVATSGAAKETARG